MDDGTIAYRKDMVYQSELEHNGMYGYITNEQMETRHAWRIYVDKTRDVEDWRDFFEKVA